jgi:hypothetical protein
MGTDREPAIIVEKLALINRFDQYSNGSFDQHATQ